MCQGDGRRHSQQLRSPDAPATCCETAVPWASSTWTWRQPRRENRGAKGAVTAIIAAGSVCIVVSPGRVPTSLPYPCTGSEMAKAEISGHLGTS
jgi:hypothetical protein